MTNEKKIAAMFLLLGIAIGWGSAARADHSMGPLGSSVDSVTVAGKGMFPL